MTEQNENKMPKLDIISALQMKNIHENEKKVKLPYYKLF
jgi:hypothetical protein